MRREKNKRKEKEAKKNYVLIKDTTIASASKADDIHDNGWCTIITRDYEWLTHSFASIFTQEFLLKKYDEWKYIPLLIQIHPNAFQEVRINIFDFFVVYDAGGIFFIPYFYTLNFICIQKIKIQIIEQKSNKLYPIITDLLNLCLTSRIMNFLFLFIKKN